MAIVKRGYFLALLLIIALPLLSCVSSSTYFATEVNIADIKSDPETYPGNVMLSGDYQGWSSENGSPPVTRSDWVVTDETGWIYVTGKSPGLDPVNDRGTGITVIGQVCENDDQVYLKADITIIRE